MALRLLRRRPARAVVPVRGIAVLRVQAAIAVLRVMPVVSSSVRRRRVGRRARRPRLRRVVLAVARRVLWREFQLPCRFLR